MSLDANAPQPPDPEMDVVADRHKLVLIGLAAVWVACLIFAILRLVVTLRTGLLTPWWGNAAGLLVITVLFAWYRRKPKTRSEATAHGTALVATLALLIPIAYGMNSTIWWLSLVGFAMVLLGRRQEAKVWGVVIFLLVLTSVVAAPYVQVPGAAGEPFVETVLSKIVFVVILLGLAVGFRLVAEQRARQLHDSEIQLRKLKGEFESRALSSEDLADQRLVRLERLNSLLQAIRHVNRLIVQEKDPQRLIDRICEVLIKARGYRHVWIALTDESGPASAVAYSGENERFRSIADKIRQGIWPACHKKVVASENRLALLLSAEDCQDCPFRAVDEVSTYGIVSLRHQEKVRGYLGIALPTGFNLNEGLLLEVAGDIAFALHAIDMERERNRSEQTVRAIFDSASDGILLADAETGRFVMANNAICNMLGYHAEEFLCLSVDDIHPPESLDRVRSQFERQARGEFNMAANIPVRRKDGSVFLADVNSSLIFLESRSHLLGVFRDVTERIQMQAQLAQADRLSSMGTLAAGVAHEINNPLSYVILNLESLAEDMPALVNHLRRLQARLADRLGAAVFEEMVGPAERQMTSSMLDDMQARLRDALGGIHRIHDVSRGLGTFSHVDEDQFVPVNIREVIDVAANMAHNEIKYRARLVKDHGHELPPVLASEGRLSQVFLNLLINATHAIDEGDLENNEIRITTRVEGDTLCAQVKDTGSGIAPENLSKLFDPFFTTKKVGEGSGLGLAISKSIVDGYGGSITVESEVGTGTCFTIRLPVLRQPVAPVEDIARHAASPFIRGRILIIDDEDGIRASMRRMLRIHETVLAASGVEAKKILAEDQAFDVILCDMMMPDVSGVDLHAWLAETHPALAKQMIFMTGGAFTPRTREYLNQVDNLQLEKPFDVANLKQIVSDRILFNQQHDAT